MRQGRLLQQGSGGSLARARIKASRAQERAVAKDVKGKRQVASGAKYDKPGDVIAPVHLIECKMTEKASYSIKLDEFKKAKLEAIMMKKRVVMAINIQGEKLAVLPWDDWVSTQEAEEERCSKK